MPRKTLDVLPQTNEQFDERLRYIRSMISQHPDFPEAAELISRERGPHGIENRNKARLLMAKILDEIMGEGLISARDLVIYSADLMVFKTNTINEERRPSQPSFNAEG